MECDAMRWSRRDEMGRDRMRWDDMGWEGRGWDGMGWDGMRCDGDGDSNANGLCWAGMR